MKIKKKKIILFCPNIFNDGLKTTLEIYLNYLVKFYKVSLITNTLNTNLLKKINKKVKVINPKINLFFNIKLFNTLICVFLFLRNLKNQSFVFSMWNHSLLLILKLFKLNFKIVLRTPNAIINYKNKKEIKYLKKNFFFNNILINLYKYANLLITFSEENTIYLKKKIGTNNIVHIYNYFRKFNGNKKVKKTYNIFFVGTLSYVKNPVFFLKNTIDLLNNIDIRIHIIGDGKYKNLLKKMSKNFSKKIFFYDFVDNPFKKFNKKMDLLCITSRYDGTPNVLGEAMSYKIPCIAPADVGLCNVLLKNGKYGYLYKSDNDLDFKKKILNALTLYKISIKKANLGYLSLDRYSKKNTLDKLNKALSKV